MCVCQWLDKCIPFKGKKTVLVLLVEKNSGGMYPSISMMKFKTCYRNVLVVAEKREIHLCCQVLLAMEDKNMLD